MDEGNSVIELEKLEHPKLKCIEEIAKLQFKNKSTKFNSDALNAFATVIKVFIGEAALRAATEAQKDVTDEYAEVKVTNEHLEKILPQLLLQF